MPSEPNLLGRALSMEEQMRLRDKVTIITGATRGIGEATAKLFAHEGAKVVVADDHVGEGEQIVKQIKADGGEAIFVKVSITNEAQVRNMVELAVSTYGTVNVLVNIAGEFSKNKIHETTTEQWEHVMNTNVRGYFWCSKYVIPYMKKAGGGSIIMASSIAGLVAEPDIPVYCTAKAGILGLVRAMALDYGRENIRVNAVCTGVVDTVSNSARTRSFSDFEKARKQVAEAQVMQRLASPMEMAYCFLFLASDESTFVTGSSLVADGGMSIMDHVLVG